MTRKSLPKYVYNDRGYLRFTRRSRGISVMMHEEAGTPEFWDHYNRLLKGKPAPAPVKRNFEALILSYYESDAYKKLKPRTRSDYRRYISHIREIWADKDPARIETHHIYELHRANADHWRQANYLVQVMVVLMNHARLIGFIKKEHGNPAKGTDRLKAHLDGLERRDGTVVTDARGRSVSYRIIAEEMRSIKKKMKHDKASYYKTHGLRKNATIELYLAGCDDEMVKAVTGHSGVEMLKKYGGPIRQRELAKRAQEARNQMERSKTET